MRIHALYFASLLIIKQSDTYHLIEKYNYRTIVSFVPLNVGELAIAEVKNILFLDLIRNGNTKYKENAAHLLRLK